MTNRPSPPNKEPARRSKGVVSSSPLDLGLQHLLHGSEPPPSVAAAEPSAATPAPSVSSAPDPWAALAADGDWRQIAARAEQHSEPGGIETVVARLWWVKSQRMLAEVPVTIIAAPLEAATALLLEQRRDNATIPAAAEQLAVELLSEVSAELKSRHDHLLALTLLERLVALRPQFKSELAPYVAELLTLEGGMQRFIKDPLRDKLQQLAAGLGPLTDPQPSEPSPEKASPAETKVTARQQRHLLTFLATALGLTIAVLGVRELLQVSPLPSLRPVLELSSAEPELLPPGFERMMPLNSLLALSYEINRTDSDAQIGAAARGGTAISSSATTPSPVPTAAPTVAAKESVNTSGPIEPQNFAKLVETPGESEPEVGQILFGEAQPKLPRLPAKYTPRPDPRDQPDRRTGAFGDRFDDPLGVEFTKFKQPKFFRVIASTTVTLRPSYRTVVLDRLEPGDRIRAEAQVGNWLKLRSKNGQLGYVLVQDVKEVPTDRDP